MTSCIADTSWLVALLNPDDRFHGQAMSQSRGMQRIHVPPAILAETLSFAKYRTGDVAVMREVIATLSGNAVFALCSPDHDHEATMRYWQGRPQLSYHDAAAIAAAHRLGLPLATFDRDQADAMGKK